MSEACGSGTRAAEALARLRARGLRVAVAESCTGGDVLATLTAAPGASSSVWGGAVVYSAAAKSSLAGVDVAFVREHGVVSEAVTRALAEGIRDRAGVDVGLAVTGWAGPESEGPDPVGTVYLGVAAPRGSRVRRLALAGGREEVRAAAVRELLALLLQSLDDDPAEEQGGER